MHWLMLWEWLCHHHHHFHHHPHHPHRPPVRVSLNPPPVGGPPPAPHGPFPAARLT